MNTTANLTEVVEKAMADVKEIRVVLAPAWLMLGTENSPKKGFTAMITTNVVREIYQRLLLVLVGLASATLMTQQFLYASIAGLAVVGAVMAVALAVLERKDAKRQKARQQRIRAMAAKWQPSKRGGN
jgi:Na+/H+-translocating membrane pyrophosphatase